MNPEQESLSTELEAGTGTTSSHAETHAGEDQRENSKDTSSTEHRKEWQGNSISAAVDVHRSPVLKLTQCGTDSFCCLGIKM